LAGAGTPVADVCRQTGIAEATFYLWKKKFMVTSASPKSVSSDRSARRTRA
jgi:transposase-like protein